MVPLLADSFFVAMAVTIMAGLGFASVLTLLGIPVLYHTYFRRERLVDAKAASNVNSLVITTPPGTADGDLLIAAVATDGNTSSTLAPPVESSSPLLLPPFLDLKLEDAP